MRSSERPSGKIVSARDLRARPYDTKSNGHYITSESRQLPEQVKGTQRSMRARLRKIRELGFNPDKSFRHADEQREYNEQIDAALIAAGWE